MLRKVTQLNSYSKRAEVCGKIRCDFVKNLYFTRILSLNLSTSTNCC